MVTILQGGNITSGSADQTTSFGRTAYLRIAAEKKKQLQEKAAREQAAREQAAQQRLDVINSKIDRYNVLKNSKSRNNREIREALDLRKELEIALGKKLPHPFKKKRWFGTIGVDDTGKKIVGYTSTPSSLLSKQQIRAALPEGGSSPVGGYTIFKEGGSSPVQGYSRTQFEAQANGQLQYPMSKDLFSPVQITQFPGVQQRNIPRESTFPEKVRDVINQQTTLREEPVGMSRIGERPDPTMSMLPESQITKDLFSPDYTGKKFAASTLAAEKKAGAQGDKFLSSIESQGGAKLFLKGSAKEFVNAFFDIGKRTLVTGPLTIATSTIPLVESELVARRILPSSLATGTQIQSGIIKSAEFYNVAEPNNELTKFAKTIVATSPFDYAMKTKETLIAGTLIAGGVATPLVGKAGGFLLKVGAAGQTAGFLSSPTPKKAGELALTSAFILAPIALKKTTDLAKFWARRKSVKDIEFLLGREAIFKRVPQPRSPNKIFIKEAVTKTATIVQAEKKVPSGSEQLTYIKFKQSFGFFKKGQEVTVNKFYDVSGKGTRLILSKQTGFRYSDSVNAISKSDFFTNKYVTPTSSRIALTTFNLASSSVPGGRPSKASIRRSNFGLGPKGKGQLKYSKTDNEYFMKSGTSEKIGLGKSGLYLEKRISPRLKQRITETSISIFKPEGKAPRPMRLNRDYGNKYFSKDQLRSYFGKQSPIKTFDNQNFVKVSSLERTKLFQIGKSKLQQKGLFSVLEVKQSGKVKSPDFYRGVEKYTWEKVGGKLNGKDFSKSSGGTADLLLSAADKKISPREARFNILKQKLRAKADVIIAAKEVKTRSATQLIVRKEGGLEMGKWQIPTPSEYAAKPLSKPVVFELMSRPKQTMADVSFFKYTGNELGQADAVISGRMASLGGAQRIPILKEITPKTFSPDSVLSNMEAVSFNRVSLTQKGLGAVSLLKTSLATAEPIISLKTDTRTINVLNFKIVPALDLALSSGLALSLVQDSALVQRSAQDVSTINGVDFELFPGKLVPRKPPITRPRPPNPPNDFVFTPPKPPRARFPDEPIPEKPVPPKPPAPFRLSFPRKNDPQFLVDSYDAFVKTKGRYVRVTKRPRTYEHAFNRGAFDVDHSTAKTFKLVKQNKQIPRPMMNEMSFSLSKKFRAPKKGDMNRFIEKNKFAIDSSEEIEGIPVKGLLARRRNSKLGRFFD